MNTFWDQRYEADEYAYGILPNQFFSQELEQVKGKRILFPAEGEGRNAVYAATKGFEVFAFDPSVEGKKKARKLATENKVSIDYRTEGYESIEYPANYFDAIVLVFAHMPPDKRTEWHRKLVGFLKPGGVVILEGFSKDQIHYGTGGPPVIEMLFNEEELRHDFSLLKEQMLESTDTKLSEGIYHQGKAAVIHGLFEKLTNFEE